MPVIQCNGADLYYEEHGEGRPIVFLHGATAGLRYFESQLTGLSNEFRAIAVDFRGHGRSERTELGHTVGQYARDVQAFLEQVELEGVVLAGWSMGALISWEYVHQFGTDRLRAIVDIDMEPSPVKRPDYEYGTYETADLREAIEAIQQDPIGLLEEQATALLKDSPTRELRNLILDEGSRTPAPIQGALMFGLSFIPDSRDVLQSVDSRHSSVRVLTRSGEASRRSSTPRNSSRTRGSNASKRAGTVSPSKSPSDSTGC